MERDALAHALLDGSRVICRIVEQRGLLDEEHADPLIPSWDDPRPSTNDRPTFIAIAVRHERGASLQGVHLQLVAPDGSPRYGVLDATGRWRTDDVPAGTCTLRFGDDLVKALEPSGPPVLVEADELWLGPDAALRLRLVTAREHRIVVVDGRTEVALVDEDDQPLGGRACVAKVGDRTLEGKSDADGRWRFHHPASIAACEITIVGTGSSIVFSKGGEAE